MRNNDLLYKKGDKIDYLYIIKTGSVSRIKENKVVAYLNEG